MGQTSTGAASGVASTFPERAQERQPPSERSASLRLLAFLSGTLIGILIETLDAAPQGFYRSNELFRRIPETSRKTFTAKLRLMEELGAVKRETLPIAPAHVRYSLTPLGRALAGALRRLEEWARAHPREFEAVCFPIKK